MPKAKHFIITSLTLGLIAAGSGALIGGVNLLTRGRIEQNEKDEFNKGVSFIFGEGSDTTNKEDLKKKPVKYEMDYFDIKVTASYEVINNKNNVHGWAITTTGSNSYGKISMIVGFDYDLKEYVNIYITEDDQTYKSTLEEKYITKITINKTKIDEVSCGATYGAKLVRDSINAAKKHVDGLK